ncbi:hypothetical protein R3W88_029741 [Solanum pinnatisectum]|uniref:Uncharacterized protein n=1 Tax=Solanum pinnatisectum TaxID=50273 RepID=A0AAV9K6M5_9SOLN|nr:hypothetical protein R3W88_029741 [Solanum pinnatisectum]
MPNGRICHLYLIVVFVVNEQTQRETLWANLNQVDVKNNYPWILCGDFTNVLSSADRMGSLVSSSEVEGFQGMMDSLQLTPLRSTGGHFTWCNKQEAGRRVYSKIDWALGDLNWLQQYGLVEADYLNPSVSDHSPILIKCLWEMDITRLPMVKVWEKLKQLKVKLKDINKYMDVFSQKLHRHIQDDLMDQMLFDQEKMLLLESEKCSRVEEQVLRHKSRATWIECGDANSKYFHAQWKIRCSHDVINFIYTENNTKLTDPRAIEAEFIGVFTRLMGTSTSNFPCLNVEVVNTSVCLTLQQQK